MAQITEIELNGTSYEIADVEARELALTNGCEYIVGTQSGTTGSWTGVTTDAALYTGKKISYKLPQPGSGNASLTLTLADGSNTNAIPVYLGTTRMTTHFGMGSVIDMTYDGQYWRATAIPNSNNFDRINHNNALKAASANAAPLPYPIAASTPIGYVDALGGYQSIVVGSVINLSKPILWATGNVEASKTFTNSYEAVPSQSVRVSFPSWTGTTYAMAYLKGSLQGTSFTVVELTCTEPSTEDGYVYIPLGILYSTYQICFRTSSAMFAYLDGSFRQISSSEILSSLNSRLSQAESDINLRVTKNELDTRTTNTDMWLYRVTPGEGIATIKSIKGNTVVWNQLVVDGNFSGSDGWRPQSSATGVSVTIADNTALVTVTDTSLSGRPNIQATASSGTPVVGHKYLALADAKKHSNFGLVLNVIFGSGIAVGDLSANDVWTHLGGIATCSATTYDRPMLYISRTTSSLTLGDTITYRNVMVFDLTQMFGAGNEPTTVAEFEALYPEAYYPYSTPTLQSAKPTGIESEDADGGSLGGISIPIETIKPEGLCSAGTVYDELTAGGLVTRIGAVDLGTLSWVTATSSRFRASLSDAKSPSSDNTKAEILCAAYDTKTANQTAAGNTGVAVTHSGNVVIYDTDYVGETAATFAAAVDGIILYYELATPTTQAIDPPLNLTYRTEAGGTEEFIIPEGHISAPPITEISYGVNAMDGIADSLARISKAESNINNMSDHFWGDSDSSYIGKNNQADMIVTDNSMSTIDTNNVKYMELSKKGIVTTVNFPNGTTYSNTNYNDIEIIALTNFFNDSNISISNNKIMNNSVETGYTIALETGTSNTYCVYDQDNNKIYNNNYECIQYYSNNDTGNKFVAIEGDELFPMAEDDTYPIADDINNFPVIIKAGGTWLHFHNKKIEMSQPLSIESGGTGTNDYGTIINNDISNAASIPNNTNKSIGSITLSKGTWLVRYCAKFDTNGTGRRQATLGTTADTITSTWQRYCGSQTPATAGGASILNGSIIRTIASSETLYLTVFQTSDGALDATGNMQAFKLK